MRKNFYLVTIFSLLFELGSGLIYVFGIIMFYQKLGNSIMLAALPLVMLHFTHASIVAIGSKYIFKLGIKKSLIVCALFYCAASFTLLTNTDLPWFALVLWSVLQAFGNAFHYIPIIYVLGHSTTEENRARLFSLRKILFIVLAIVSPLLGGLLAAAFDLSGIMIVSFAFFVLLFIPISIMDDFKANYTTSLKEAYKLPHAMKITIFRVVQILADHMTVFWPLYIFLLLSKNYVETGTLFTLVNFIAIVVVYVVGKTINKRNELKMFSQIKWSSTLAWFARALSFNYISAVIVDTVYKLNENFRNMVLDVIDFEMLDNKSGTDIKLEYIIIREVVANYAVAAVYIIYPLLITIFGFTDAFIVVGIVTFIGMTIVEKTLKNIK